MPEAGETTKTLRRGLLGPTTSSAPGLTICQPDSSGMRALRSNVLFLVRYRVLTLLGRVIVLCVRNVFPTIADEYPASVPSPAAILRRVALAQPVGFAVARVRRFRS
jgi:hypothetical protein